MSDTEDPHDGGGTETPATREELEALQKQQLHEELDQLMASVQTGSDFLQKRKKRGIFGNFADLLGLLRSTLLDREGNRLHEHARLLIENSDSVEDGPEVAREVLDGWDVIARSLLKRGVEQERLDLMHDVFLGALMGKGEFGKAARPAILMDILAGLSPEAVVLLPAVDRISVPEERHHNYGTKGDYGEWLKQALQSTGLASVSLIQRADDDLVRQRILRVREYLGEEYGSPPEPFPPGTFPAPSRKSILNPNARLTDLGVLLLKALDIYRRDVAPIIDAEGE